MVEVIFNIVSVIEMIADDLAILSDNEITTIGIIPTFPFF